jgi:hypothetical protein
MDGIQNLMVRAGDAFIQIQENLNLDGHDRLTRFAPIWKLMQTLTPELADSLIPSTRAIHELDTDFQFQFRRDDLRQFGVELSFLNLAYITKFELARFGQCHIQLKFKKVDLPER